MKKLTFLLMLHVLIFFCAATVTAQKVNSGTYKDIDSAVSKNNFEEGINVIKKGQEGKKPLYPESNAISLFLDKGLLEHYAGNYSNSSEDLQEAERLISEAFTKSITAGIASYIANDNTKDYAGEDFEDIYLSVFNALNYYNRGYIEDALVEIRKLSIPNGKLDILSRKYEEGQRSAGDWALEQLDKILGIKMAPELPQGNPVNFSNSALARYLAALFYLGEGNEDSARIEFEQLIKAFTNTKIYTNSIPNAVAETQNVPKGKARLNIIGFSGLSPVKEENIFSSNLPLPFKYSALQQANFKLPRFVDRPSVVNQIEVIVGTEKLSLELLEDMGSVIKETYNAKFANLYFKTYIRVLLKYATAQVAADQIAQTKAGRLGAIASTVAAKKGLDATEGADIRMSRYMPDKAYIGGINLDPGTYTVTINYYSGRKIVASYERKDINIRANAVNLIEAYCLQ